MNEDMKNLVRRMYEEAWNENRLEVIDEINDDAAFRVLFPPD